MPTLVTDPPARLWRQRGAARPLVSVFEEDPDLLAGVEPGVAEGLRRAAVATRTTIERGPWEPPEDLRGGLGVLVLDGLLVQTLTLDGRPCPHLLGAGDLVRPADQRDPGAVVDLRPGWQAVVPTRLAVLDARFAHLVGPHPAVVSALLGRTAQTARHLAFHLAIAHIPRAEHRMHVLLWHLADRWGRVRADGVHVPFPLTHRLLGALACVQRPTASNALAALCASGQVSRCPDGSWLLLGEPPAC